MPAPQVAELLRSTGKTVATAESCTGGLLAKRLTDIPGASDYFLEGVITYSNEAKTRLLGVKKELIEQHGAVSEQVAVAMAFGCRVNSGADYAISITGVAGPTGGTPEKPVGLVYIGLANNTGCRVTELRLGEQLSRQQIREQTTVRALQILEAAALDPPQ